MILRSENVNLLVGTQSFTQSHPIKNIIIRHIGMSVIISVITHVDTQVTNILRNNIRRNIWDDIKTMPNINKDSVLKSLTS